SRKSCRRNSHQREAPAQRPGRDGNTWIEQSGPFLLRLNDRAGPGGRNTAGPRGSTAGGPPRITARIGAIDRVICPIDLTGVWESDAIRAADIARMFDVPLVLVHVLRRLRAVPWLTENNRPRDRDRIATAAAALQRVSARLPQGVRSTSTVLVGDPAHEIARLARRASPLVVMSLRGTRAVWGRRGAIAYQVLSSSSAPVLALPRRRLGGPLETRLRRTINETLSTRDRSEIAGIDALLSIGPRAKS